MTVQIPGVMVGVDQSHIGGDAIIGVAAGVVVDGDFGHVFFDELAHDVGSDESGATDNQGLCPSNVVHWEPPKNLYAALRGSFAAETREPTGNPGVTPPPGLFSAPLEASLSDLLIRVILLLASSGVKDRGPLGFTH